MVYDWCILYFFFQAEDGIRDLVRSRGLGDVYKRQALSRAKAASVATGASDERGDMLRDRPPNGRSRTAVSYTHLTLPTIYSV